MKNIIFIFAILFTNLTLSIASDIKGLNSEQKNDLDKCLKMRGLNFEQINQWENNIFQGSEITYIYPLYHNFNLQEYEIESFEDGAFQDAIITSGTFHTNQHHSFENSIIANVTFIGDISKLSFNNSCLVNVRFYQAGIFKMMKIKYKSQYYKNISE